MNAGVSEREGFRGSFNPTKTNRRSFLTKVGGAALFGITAGVAAVVTEKITGINTDSYKFEEETYSQKEEQSQPFDNEYDTLPAPGYPHLERGALVITKESWERYWKDESNRLDKHNRTPEQRPIAYRMILMMEDSSINPKIIVSPKGYVSVEQGKLKFDDKGNTWTARLESLPRENNRAILHIIEIMPDGTQIPKEPNIITFPQYKYPPQTGIRTAIYSTEPIDASVASTLYPMQEKFRDFAGVDFSLSFYNPGDESIDIPPFIQRMAGTNAVLPQSVSEEADLNFVEIVGYYSLAERLYDSVNGNDPRFKGDAELAKYRLDDALKKFVEENTGRIPMVGIYPEGTKITEENDRAAVALGVCDIANYLNQADKGKFHFGNIRRDPRAFFASLLTVANFFGMQFSNAKDDELALGRQISRDVMEIGRPVYTLLRLINDDRNAQERLVSGLFRTGLASHESF